MSDGLWDINKDKEHYEQLTMLYKPSLYDLQHFLS